MRILNPHKILFGVKGLVGSDYMWPKYIALRTVEENITVADVDSGVRLGPGAVPL